VLRDDIRGQAVLDLGDLVFQAQFLLFQPPNGQLISGGPVNQRSDGFVQIAVLAAKLC
jgi:hypothetical protein